MDMQLIERSEALTEMATQRTERSEALQAQILQCLTTEQFVLQSGRSMTVADASSRSILFLSTISSTLIALAFIGQISRLGGVFFLFAIVLFPSLVFLGLVTFERVLQSAIEDMVCMRGMNRIRHYYVELAPQVKDYFILSTFDDEAGDHGNMCMPKQWWQLFLTTAGMIGAINSILAGAFAGLLLYHLFALPLLPCLGAAIVIFLLVLVAHQWYQWRSWRRAEGCLKVLFPSEAEEECEVPIQRNMKVRTNKEQFAGHDLLQSDQATADVIPHEACPSHKN